MPKLPPQDNIQQQVQLALEEDIGSGDISAELISSDKNIKGFVVCREAAVLCGQAWFDEVFQQLDSNIKIIWYFSDGDQLKTNDRICTITGSARPILSGERTALNFLQTLSGVATTTEKYVVQLKDTNCKLLDTRKTIPGLRLAEKYAVRCGGGVNHRMGLYDAYLIKENHIIAAGSIKQAITNAREKHPEAWIEVEVETLDELQQSLDSGAQRILLDNMDIHILKKAVALTKGHAELEASGGIDISNLQLIAKTGVDFISVGTITKHLHATDYSMCFDS